MVFFREVLGQISNACIYDNGVGKLKTQTKDKKY